METTKTLCHHQPEWCGKRWWFDSRFMWIAGQASRDKFSQPTWAQDIRRRYLLACGSEPPLRWKGTLPLSCAAAVRVAMAWHGSWRWACCFRVCFLCSAESHHGWRKHPAIAIVAETCTVECNHMRSDDLTISINKYSKMEVRNSQAWPQHGHWNMEHFYTSFDCFRTESAGSQNHGPSTGLRAGRRECYLQSGPSTGDFFLKKYISV
jgi:hypothetical protein